MGHERATVETWLAAKYREWKLAASILIAGAWHSPLVDPDELRCLADYAAKAPGDAVEIGTFNGASTSVISRSLSRGIRLTAIDPYVADSMIPSLRGSPLVAWCAVLRHGHLSTVRLVRDYSSNVVKTWTTAIGLLWIDGSHRYEDVKRDFEEWAPFVRPGGYVIFHDSNRTDLSTDEVFDNGWRGPTLVCNEIKQHRSHQYAHETALKSINVFRKL